MQNGGGAGRRQSERRRPRVAAPVAPHQPIPARDGAGAMERGGVAAGQGRVQDDPRDEESDSTRGLVQLIVTEAPADVVRSGVDGAGPTG